VILTYPQKYWSEANGHAHHLVKYMEYKNGTPALHWFNYAGLAAAGEMDWNEAEAHLIPKFETELNAIATTEFDWLDCPTQSDTVNWPAIDTEDLSVTSFDAGHKPSGKVVADNDSLAMAQASVAGTVPSSASTTIQGSSKLAPINVDAMSLYDRHSLLPLLSEPRRSSCCYCGY